MNEANERREENIANEAVETAAPIEEQVQPAVDDRENAPRGSESAAEEGAVEKTAKKGKKKRRRAKIALSAAALMLVIALLFGMVVGYALGRNVGAERLRDAEARVAALTEAFEEAAAAPVYDAFTEEITGENQGALNDLSGLDYADDGVSGLLGEADLLGEMLEGGETESVVVAEYNGGKIMSDEAAKEYEEQLTNLVFAGYSEEDIAETLLDEVLKYMVSDRILEEKAREMGLYDLTDADRARIETEAQQAYDEQLEFYRAFVDTAGMTEAEATGAVKNYMQSTESVTLEGIRSQLEESWWAQKLYDELTRDVSVGEDELEAAYESLLAQQKESFASYADDYEFAQMNGETIVYNLDGYRAVRMLLFSFDDPEALEAVSVLSEEITELDPTGDAELIAQYTAQIDGYYEAVEAEARAALAEIQAGADFDEMLISVGDDEGMKDEALRETGYYVSKDSLLWTSEVIGAAMALEEIGDLSGIVRVGDGVCILEYVGEVPAGEVKLADVHDALLADATGDAKYSAYQAKVDAWLQEANAVYYPERLQ